MIRHAGRAAALFAIGALFAGGAWAQDTEVSLVQSVDMDSVYPVAEELIGPGGETILLSSPGGTTNPNYMRPVVRLTVTNDPAGTGIGIAAGNTAEITFDLTGAIFAQDVGSGDLDLRDGSNAIQPGFASEVVAGGAIGDDSVTFLVEAVSEFAEMDEISFWVPNLEVMPMELGMMGDPPAPVIGAGIVANVVQKRSITSVNGGAVSGVPFPMMVSGASNIDGSAIVMARQVVRLLDVVNISMAGGGEARVALDARTVFAPSPDGVMVPMGDGEANALRVGTLSISVDASNGALTLDPAHAAVHGTDGLHADLQGEINVMVKGAFKTDGMVVYGPSGGPYMEAELIASDVAEANVGIPTAAGGGTTMTDFLYVPGGVDVLRPGKITALAMAEFTRMENNMGMPVMSEGEIFYAGLGVQGYAHGVVKGGGMDSSQLRVRCATEATDCAVFLDCYDQDGNNYFQEAGVISSGGLAVWSSDQVAEVLKGGWSKGRGACNLVSNDKLEVQHMVLSNHTLINNSDVVGREVSGDTEAFAAVRDRLEDICNSLEGAAGRNAGTSGGGRTVTAQVATPCYHKLARIGDGSNLFRDVSQDGLQNYDTDHQNDDTI